MCGIFGFIGKSKEPEVSYEIINALMLKTESRGSDATGFWATERGANGSVWYDKEPVKSSIYATRDIWKSFKGVNADLFLGHCRQKSVGVGNEKSNINNHPHVSEDRSIAMIHNGRIHDYDIIKKRYELKGECDSELLLSMYLSGYNYKDDKEYLSKSVPQFEESLSCRALGMMEIFKYIGSAALAFAVGDRGENGERVIWLHRNNDRPIHLVDLTDTLGQIFYFSTIEIWKSAINSLYPAITKTFVTIPHKIAIFPSDEMWLFKINPNEKDEDVWVKDKYKILQSDYREYSEEDLPKNKIKYNSRNFNFKVVSRLNNNDVIQEETLSLEEDKKKA